MQIEWPELQFPPIHLYNLPYQKPDTSHAPKAMTLTIVNLRYTNPLAKISKLLKEGKI